MEDMKLQGVSIKFFYHIGAERDGEAQREVTVEASIGPEGYQQWGAIREQLGHNVDILTEITKVVQENLESGDE